MKKQLSYLSFIFLSLSLNSLADTTFVARDNDTSVEITYTIVDDSEVTINRIDPTATGDLVIPDTIEGLPVTRSSAAFYQISLTSLTLPETLTALGNRREFWHSYNLVTVIMPGVTNIVSQAFRFCNNLETVICSPNLTAVNNNAFEGCEKISIVILPATAGYGLNTFYQSGLTELHLNGEEPLHPYNYAYGATIDNGTTPSVIVKSEYSSTFATDANGLWNRERDRGQGFVQSDMLLVVGEPKTDYGFYSINTVPTESVDTDGDGVGDNADTFPNDPTESADTDGDGVGDNADAFPSDATETVDTDGDSVGDNADAFPSDPSETADTDGDGMGDNGDSHPNDPGTGWTGERTYQSQTFFVGPGSDLSDLNLEGMDLSGANLHGAILDGARLRFVNFTGTDLRGASLQWSATGWGNGGAVNLDNATLTDALLDGIITNEGDIISFVIHGLPSGYTLVNNNHIVEVDTDGDGVGDNGDVHPGYNDAELTTYLSNNNYVKTSEIIDARAGSTLITVSNGVATVELEMEQSDDLQTWSEIDGSTSMDIPAGASVKFFRFKMAD